MSIPIYKFFIFIDQSIVIKVNKKINWKNYKLNKENKELEAKVNQGSILEVYDISVDAFAKKTNFKYHFQFRVLI